MASVEVNKVEGKVLETASSLVGKLEGELEIKSKAEDFHDMFSCRPHHISNASPDKVHGCGMREGDWGTPGSTIVWDYVHDGKKCYAKEIIEAIDHKNNSTTFRVIEGDVLELYKNFRFTVKATLKKGEASGFFSEPGISDHSAAILRFASDIRRKPWFRFQNFWALTDEFKESLRRNWTRRCHNLFQLKSNLKFLKKCLIVDMKTHRKDMNKRVEEYRLSLEEVQSQVQAHPCDKAKEHFHKEKANLVSYSVLIDGLCREGDMSQVESLVTEMQETGFRPDNFVYTSWIAGLCRQGNLVEAFRIKNKMSQEGIQPCLLTYTSLVWALVNRGLMIEAKQVLKDMLRMRIAPDQIVIDILIQGYLKLGNTDAVSNLRDDLRKKGLFFGD